jgi:hypothetical protein
MSSGFTNTRFRPDSIRFYVLFQTKQRIRPKLRERTYPSLVNLSDRHYVQRIDALSAVLAGVYQARIAQHVDMLHHRESGHVGKRLDDLRRGLGPYAQQVQDRPPRWVGQRFPNHVEFVGHISGRGSGGLGKVVLYSIEKIFPSGHHVFLVRWIQHPYGPMAQRNSRPVGDLIEFDLDMV